MVARIAVYQLSHKFVNRREDVPENARQVVYYALALGHHVGVMDCFSSLVEIPLLEFTNWLEGLPEGSGKAKLVGVTKWGEIEINLSHVGSLLTLLDDPQDGIPWLKTLKESLQAIIREPALYLMVKKLT
jgi:hydrogenase-4 component J